MKNKLLMAAVLSGLCSGIATPTLAATNDEWQWSLTPYAWLPSLNGELNYDGVSGSSGIERPGVELGPNDYLSNINFAFAMSWEAHKGDWGFLGDFFYYNGDVGNARVRNLTGPGGSVVVPINRDTTVDLKDTVLEFAGTYSISREGKSYFDVLAGFRYYNLDTALKWDFTAPTAGLSTSGKISQKADIWNAVVGVNGRAALGDGNWFVPYYLDYGFGNVNSWQGMIGVGYGFGWGDLALSERYQKLSNGNHLLDNLELNGPMLGATFHF